MVGSSGVFDELRPLSGNELAKLAAVLQDLLLLSLRLVGGLQLHQTIECSLAHLVTRAGRVQLELMYGVGVVVTGVAAHLNRVRYVDVLELPLVSLAALLNVIDVLKALQMLVRFTVELEIGPKVRLVRAELADITASNCH